MPRSCVFIAGLAVAVSACAHPDTSRLAEPSGPIPSERLAAADALVRAGCLDCLGDAYRDYEVLRSMRAVADAAAAGLVRAAALIALRERELGMVDDGYLDRARTAVSGNDALLAVYGVVLDVIDATRRPRAGVPDPEAARRLQTVSANRDRWLELLRAHADGDPLWASTWLWFSCANNPNRAERDLAALVAPLARLREAPIAVYQASVCAAGGNGALDELLASNPRFLEIEYWLGMRELSAQHLDEAQAHLARAYAWHPAWPLLTTSLAGLYMTAEEFDAALDLHEQTLALVPGAPDAMVGRVRALSYLARHADAVAAATDLLSSQAFPGEALYWRAWNELRLERTDEAWADVEMAERVWVNAEVSKLAGIIAYERHELDVARGKFEAAKKIASDDCETLFDLAGVNLELDAWLAGADGYAEAAQCLERGRAQTAAEIAVLQQSAGPPERIARQVARRGQQMAAATRMLVQSWFNRAIADVQLQRKDDARQLAQKVADDEQFGARARALLLQLRP